jgi:CRISPR-associated endonuclease Csn1
MEKPYLILGLDPGIASCGFCLLDIANHRILELGVHLFDAPQEKKTNTSLAATRRNARSSRRNTKRRADRKKHCLSLFKEYSLVPNDASKHWLQTSKGDKPILSLRAKGLNEALTDRELAQVLYSLASHRGYIPHSEGGLKDSDGFDADTGKVLRAVGENSKLLKDGGFRTIGEMLYQQGHARNKGGAYEHCVLNSQIVDEVRTLFESQRSFNNAHATYDFQERYLEVLT